MMVRLARTAAWLSVATATMGITPAHAQDVISGKYYRFSVVGRSGLSGIADVLNHGPSINNAGAVAFSARTSINNAVFVGDVAAAAPRLIHQNTNQSFLGGTPISDTHHVLTLDATTAIFDGYRRKNLLDWNATPPGPYTNSLVAAGNVPATPDFLDIYFSTSDINSAGHVVFAARKSLPGVPPTTVDRLVTGRRPAFVGQLDMSFTLADTPRPQLTDNGRVVVRAGASVVDPIRLYNYQLTMFEDIATRPMGFDVIGRSPGVSSSGAVVAFFGQVSQNPPPALGDRRAGETGIFASVDLGPADGGRKIIRLARRDVERDSPGLGNYDGVCDQGEPCESGELGHTYGGVGVEFDLNGFQPDARVGVTHLDAGPAKIEGDSFVVAFLGTPSFEDTAPALFTGDVPSFVESERRPLTVYATASCWSSAPS